MTQAPPTIDTSSVPWWVVLGWVVFLFLSAALVWVLDSREEGP